MTRIIDAAVLSEARGAQDRREAQESLDRLAPWLMTGLPPPALPTAPGTCLVLLAWEQPMGPWLDQGFALPFRWIRDCRHEASVPPALTAVADLAVAACARDLRTKEWGLALDLPGYDLSRLPLAEAGSAWASLATALILADGELPAQPAIGLTGAWDDRTGIRAVTSLPAKLAAARRLGLTTVFVPAAGPLLETEGLTLCLLHGGKTRVRDALAEALRALAVPPTDDEPLERRWAYADLLSGPEKNRYLVEHAAAEQGVRLAAQVPVALRECRTLLSLLSSSAAATAALALPCRRVVLLHSQRDRGLAEASAAVLRRHGRDVDLTEVRRDDPAGLAQAVTAARPEVLDLTGGTKFMALCVRAAAPEVPVLVLDGNNDLSHRSGSECLRFPGFADPIPVRAPDSPDPSGTRTVPPAPREVQPVAVAAAVCRCSAGTAAATTDLTTGVEKAQDCPPPPWPLATRRLRFGLRLEANGRLPVWKGSLLRGILGHGLAGLGRLPAPRWPGLRPGVGFAQAVFEIQESWDDPRSSAPWTLRLADDRTTWLAGAELGGELLLHGPWPDWAVGCMQEALSQGLALGLGADRLPALLSRWEDADASRPGTAPCPEVLCLRLLVPARLRDDHADGRELSPGVVSRSLLRRADRLCRQLTGTSWVPAEAFPDLAAAGDTLTVVDCAQDPATLRRWSNRQHRSIAMDAVLGSITLTGPALARCWPWLSLAPLLNLGRQAHLGMGVCDIVVRSDAERRHTGRVIHRTGSDEKDER